MIRLHEYARTLWAPAPRIPSRRGRVRRWTLRGGVLLLLSALAAPVGGQTCAAPRTIKLNVLLDISSAMAYARTPDNRFREDEWKIHAASGLASGILDGFHRDGVLSAAGSLGIPTGFGDGRDVTAAHIPDVEDFADGLITRILDYSSPQDLFEAIRRGADHLGSVSGAGSRKVMIVVSHLGNTAWGSESAAADAIRRSGASVYLYYVGDPAYSDDPRISNSYGSLRNIAAASGARISNIRRSTSISSFVDYVLREEGCANFAPTARATATPTSLRLGDPGFTVRFDASASSDVETPSSSLRYEWVVARVDGSSRRTHSGTGAAGAIFTPAFTTADIGPWTWAVTVRDGGGAPARASGSFEVLNSPPRIELQGGGTIDVLEALAVRTTITEDLDGGTLTFEWEQLGGPYVQEDAGVCWTCQEVGWTTEARDITVLSDGTRVAPAWRFRLTARDDEGEEAHAELAVDVANLPVPVEISGPETVRVGERLTLRSVRNEDPDGGEVTRSWDVVQAPIGALAAPTMSAGLGVSPEETLDFATTSGDAGTWIFRLDLTDDEGESATDKVTVLVSAPPVAELDAPEQIGSLRDPLYLNGEASMDPDSPCGPPDWCHRNIEGPVTGITTPPIVRWSWRVLDVPIEQREAYRPGGVQEVLSVPADGPRVDLSPGTLPPGEWTFQLEVEDAEGDTDDARVQVEVLDQSGNPVAVVTPPRRYDVDALGHPPAAVQVSAEGSIDPDNLGGAGPLPGIEEWHWSVLSGPGLCESVREPAPEQPDRWTLFGADEAVDPECHGVWRLLLTVEDDDEPTAREDSASTTVIIGNCPDPVCIDYPAAGDPILIRPGEAIDIPIYYHVDSGLRDSPTFSGGMAARLDVLYFDDPATPVYTAYSPNISPPETGASLAFHWTGHRGVRGPRLGLYHVRVSLLDATGTPVFSVTQENAVAVAGEAEVFDCGWLWNEGFPDRRDGGAFPCVEYVEPYTVSSARYRVYHPPHWDELDPRNPALLRWTADAVRESWTVLSTISRMPDLAVVISPRLHPAPELDQIEAAAFTFWPDSGEPCPIVIYPTGIELESAVYRQMIAHEVAHCLQHRRFGYESEDKWWSEGTAEFLGSLVYPTTNAEFGYAEDYLHDAPLHHQEYETAVFFQSITDPATPGALDLIRLMGTLASPEGRDDPVAAMEAVPGMAAALHTFARDWFASRPGGIEIDGTALRWTRVRDLGGGSWPALRPLTPVVVAEGPLLGPFGDVLPEELSLEGSTIVSRYSPFSIHDLSVAFTRGWVYRVRATHTGTGSASLLRTPGLGIWEPLPAEVRPGCGRGAPTLPIVVTNVSPTPDDHEVRITITAEPDPACR